MLIKSLHVILEWGNGNFCERLFYGLRALSRVHFETLHNMYCAGRVLIAKLILSNETRITLVTNPNIFMFILGIELNICLFLQLETTIANFVLGSRRNRYSFYIPYFSMHFSTQFRYCNETFTFYVSKQL